MFRSAAVTNPAAEQRDAGKNNITELSNVTPDFSVKMPQKYSKLGIDKTSSGLELHSYKLANGHRVTVIPMENSPATVKNYVNVGSMNETDDIKGISHFLEHMAFNGTNGEDGHVKLERGDSFKKIDEMGGWTNASTNYSLTDYVNSTPLLDEGDLEKQIKITASMMEDLALLPSMIEKEKNPVSSEIDMILDSPETVALDQTVRTLFNIKSSADELVGGSVEHIKNLTKEKVADYYNKYYTPDNMHLVITGDVNPDEVMQIVSKHFVSQKQPAGKRYEEKLTPINNTVRKDFITDKAQSCTIVAGFAGPSTNSVKDTIITDVMTKYLLTNDAGLKKDLKRLNASGALGYEKITTSASNPTFLFYALDCAESDSEEVLKLVFDKMSNLKPPSDKKLEIIKNSLLKDYNDAMESSILVNTVAGKSLFDNNLEYLTDFESILNSITQDDIKNYINKYLNISKSAITVVHPLTTEDDIIDNYVKAQKLSFKGTKRTPLNPAKVEETTLQNNYKLGYTISKNNNMPFVLSLNFELPENVNPAAIAILNGIMSEGTMDKTDEEFENQLDSENIAIGASVGKTKLSLSGFCDKNHFDSAVSAVSELLYSPRITEDTFNSVKNRVLNRLERAEVSANDLFIEEEKYVNNLVTSKQQFADGLKTVTLDDVKNLYEYIMKNSTGTVAINIPENDISQKEKAAAMFKEFSSVKPFDYKIREVYTPNDSVKVLTGTKNASQAEIKQIYKFKRELSDKEKITGNIMNYILSSSESIGLFNSLRERDHLAYRVNSDLKTVGDEGILSLNILTSTDNKDTGVQTYDNLQKSINGFNRQINKLVTSQYTDHDIETAKRVLKAELLNNESVYTRLANLNNSIRHGKSPAYENQLYEIIDSVTREDIDNLSQKVFAGSPIYAITASKETLDANKEFLESLKN